MTRTRKIILCIVAAVMLLLVAAAAGLALYTGSANSYSAQLSRGQKYLDDNDFENAVLCYQRAVNADPEQAEGYLGLAQAYMGLNKFALAQNVLNTGLERTGSARMEWMLETYFTDAYGAGNAVQVDLPSKGNSGELDLALLEQIATYTYDDYRAKQLIQSENLSGGTYQVETTALTLSFYNTDEDKRVIDSLTGKPYSTHKPNVVSLQDVSTLFGGDASVSLEELEQTGVSDVRKQESDDQGWIVTFQYAGCEGRIACDEDGTIHAGAWNQFVPAQTGDEGEGVSVQGQIINAQTGSGVSGATLEIRAETGETDPLEVQSTAGGRYTATLPEGRYTVHIRCSGFVEEDFDLTVRRAVSNQNFTISPQLAEGEIRIVLEWGASPRDLDSHLTGTTDSGVQVRTDYTHKSEVRDGVTLAQLDVDDTNGYGPETTTIYEPNGVYEFYVVDFTGSGTMSDSGATVKIYVGNQAPQVVNICAGLGNQWSVCRIDHGEVQILNTAA